MPLHTKSELFKKVGTNFDILIIKPIFVFCSATKNIFSNKEQKVVKPTKQ